MMGLKTRLALARTLVWVGTQTSPEVLAQLVRELCAARADVLVLAQPDARDEDLLAAHQVSVQAAEGRTIVGLAGSKRLARRAGADLVAAGARNAPTRSHAHALALAVAGDVSELARALTDDDVDAVVVTPALVPAAAELAPPAAKESKPWFAQAESLAEAESLVLAGARRLAVELAPLTAATDAYLQAREAVAAYRAALATPWREEMEDVSLAAFADAGQFIARPHRLASARLDGRAPGRPVPDAPAARAQPHGEDAVHQDEGPGHVGDRSKAHRDVGPDDW